LFSLVAIGIIVARLWAAQSEVVEHACQMSRKVAFMLASQVARTVETSNSTLLKFLPNLSEFLARDMAVNFRDIAGKRIANAVSLRIALQTAHQLKKTHRVGSQVRCATSGCLSFSTSSR